MGDVVPPGIWLLVDVDVVLDDSLLVDVGTEHWLPVQHCSPSQGHVVAVHWTKSAAQLIVVHLALMILLFD